MAAPTPQRTVPVTLVIGDRTYLAGSVPDVLDEPELEETIRPILDHLLGTVRGSLEHAAEVLASTRDQATILEAHKAALTLAVRTTPYPIDPVGPMVRYLRVRAGVSRTALAKAMGRSRRSVAAWENGKPTRFHTGDDRRASEALGYAPSALMAIFFQLMPENAPTGSVTA